MQLDVRQRSGVHFGGPGRGGGDLPVQDDGHVQIVLAQNLQHEPDLFVGFLDVQRLGEEVSAYLQACILGAFQIFDSVGIFHQLAAFVTPVAQADNGEFDAGGLDGVPVNIALIGGNVHTGVAFHILQQQVVFPVVLEIVAVIGIPVRRDGGIFRFGLGDGRLQNGLLYFLRCPYRGMAFRQCLRVFVSAEIRHTQHDHHNQQHGGKGGNDAHDPFRPDPGTLAKGGDHLIRFGIGLLHKNRRLFRD